MHATFTHEALIFFRFALRSAASEEIEIFEFPIEYSEIIKFLITFFNLKVSKLKKNLGITNSML